MPSCYICKLSKQNIESRERKLTFHCFPTKHKEILAKWLEFSRLSPDTSLKYLFLCSAHFADTCFIRNPLKVCLKTHSVPTLIPPSPDHTKKNSPKLPGKSEKDVDTEEVTGVDVAVAQNELPVLKDRQDMQILVDYETSAPDKLFVKDQSLLGPRNYDDDNRDILMEYVKQKLCRICGKRSNELTSIFDSDISGEEANITLEKKLRLYLPIKVSRSDELPLKICLKCLFVVESWHELYVSCLAADAVLRRTFDSNKSKVLSIDSDCNNCEVIEDQEIKIRGNKGNAEDPFSGIRKEHVVQFSTESVKPEDKSLRENNSKTDHLYTKNDLHKCVPSSVAKLINLRCKFCGMSFQVKKECVQHRKQCALEPAICDICGKTVRERRLLNSHLQRHVFTPSLCEKCGHEFPTKQSLFAHKSRCHKKVSGPKYFCEPCCKVFSSEQTFKRHEEWHKKNKNLKFRIFSSNCCQANDKEHFICPICNISFYDKLSLITHMNSMKQTSCAKCNAVLRNEKDVFQHDCRKWLCCFCDSEFSKFKSYRQHRLFHLTEKEFLCKLCGRKCPSLMSFYQHQNSHKPCKFSCKMCGQQFRRRYKFNDHMRNHEGIKLKCSLCDREYRAYNSLSKHTVKFHPGIKIKYA